MVIALLLYGSTELPAAKFLQAVLHCSVPASVKPAAQLYRPLGQLYAERDVQPEEQLLTGSAKKMLQVLPGLVVIKVAHPGSVCRDRVVFMA